MSKTATVATDFRSVAANRAFTMRGVDYKPGDPVDVTGLSDFKISQLLNQRMFRPAPPQQEEEPTL